MMRLQRMRKRAAALSLFAADEKLCLTAKEHEASQTRHEQAARLAKIWQAAIPLKNAMRFERIAAEHRAALQRRQTEQQPLMDLLTDAADRYAQALQARIDGLRGQETLDADRIKGLQLQARELRNTASQCSEEIAKHKANVSHIEAILNEDCHLHQKLQSNGVLLLNEVGSAGKE